MTGEVEYITVNITCSNCRNANRAARRACTRCGHTGIEGTRRIKNETGKPLKLGGIMPDFTKPPPSDHARNLPRSAS
jgi:hypothetical protein